MQKLPWVSLILATAVCAIFILALPILPGEQALSLTQGDIAPQDIVAPRAVSFTSAILTRQAREKAIADVPPVYDPPDPHVARKQADDLRNALFRISIIRGDHISSAEEKRVAITTLPQIRLSTNSAEKILSLTDAEWVVVSGESEAVLERIMRQQIRPDQLESTRNTLPAYVSLTLPENETSLVTELVISLIVPNSLYNADATETLRNQAAATVIPVSRSFVSGQVVISRGQIVSGADIESFTMLGLSAGSLDARTAVSNTAAVLLITLLLVISAAQFHSGWNNTSRSVLILCLINLFFVAGARVIIPGHTVLPFVFPTVALAIVTATLFGSAYGILNGILFSILTGLIAGGSLEIAFFGSVGCIVSVLSLGQGERPVRYFAAGLASALVQIAVIFVVRLREPATDLTGILTLSGATIANGVLAGSLAFMLLFVIGNLFDITTNLQLLEISRPDHPLLRLLLRDAPGTYQHSLQVANLAEAAGERIHANTLLLRVGALYHDCGKAMRPKFFVENQGVEGNPHNLLDPASSAKLILQHTMDGLDLARKYRLPSRVRDLIPEHHGTLRTNFQFGLAVQAAGGDPAQVDESLFRYLGPRPHSKEAAILMLADGTEAKFRAVAPTSPEAIEQLVQHIIDDRLSQRQFDETDLTMHDLELIKLAFADTLRGSIHPRLRYPEDDTQKTDTPPSSQPDANPA
jgi:cyclic-di-AMP phosphodiesterase PgpH